MPSESQGKLEDTVRTTEASLPTRHSTTPAGHLLAVSIAEGQTEVVLLQEVKVLTDQVKQHLAPAVLLRKREELL